MKYLLYTSLFALFSFKGSGQVMQASIGPGSSLSRVKIYIKPTTAVNGFINTFEFDVAISAAISPAPSVSIVGTPAFGISWYKDPSFVEDGYRHYHFINLTNPSISIGAGVETQVMELQFSGGPVTSNNVSLVTLPGGGANAIAWFYFSGPAASVSGQLYYSRAGTTVINNTSYLGTQPSSATIGGVLLPVKMLSLNLFKQGNDGYLTWSVRNDEADHHYELQRSFNSTSFTTVTTINRSTTGSKEYSYTDRGILNQAASMVYYRIKQVDINGKINYSDIRSLKAENQKSLVNIFPNPVKDGFTVNIQHTASLGGTVRLNLLGANGELIRSRELSALQTMNYYFGISGMALPAGNYYLQIIVSGKLLETKKIFVIK